MKKNSERRPDDTDPTARQGPLRRLGEYTICLMCGSRAHTDSLDAESKGSVCASCGGAGLVKKTDGRE